MQKKTLCSFNFQLLKQLTCETCKTWRTISLCYTRITHTVTFKTTVSISQFSLGEAEHMWTRKILNISHTQLLEMSHTKPCLLQCCWSPLVPPSHWAAPVCWPSRLTDASSSAIAAHHQRHYWLDSLAPAGGEGGEEERWHGEEEGRRREGGGGRKGKEKRCHDHFQRSHQPVNTSIPFFLLYTSIVVLRTPLNKSL